MQVLLNLDIFCGKWASGRDNCASDTNMMLLRHFPTSYDTLATYNGETFTIPPYHCMIMVPCFADHKAPSMAFCQLLTHQGVKEARDVSLMIMYLIDNTTDVPLSIKQGDVLGKYYTGPHAGIKAEKCDMFICQYEQIMGGELVPLTLDVITESMEHPLYPSPVGTPALIEDFMDDLNLGP